MLKRKALLFGAAVLLLPHASADAGSRYSTPPATQLSSDLASPWILQLRKSHSGATQPKLGITQPAGTSLKRKSSDWKLRSQQLAYHKKKKATGIFAPLNRKKKTVQQPVRKRKKLVAAPQRKKLAYARINTPAKKPQPARPTIDPKFHPKTVSYETSQKPGTIIIDTNTRFLYLVMSNGEARRYGVGVGKAGFEWAGTNKISRKAEWPSWRPPAEMIARERKKGRELPTFMEGGPANPMGARALYLGSTLYRIHGTNQPWSIGQAVSSGCIRMRNEDVMDLYERVNIGAKVIVS